VEFRRTFMAYSRDAAEVADPGAFPAVAAEWSV
jgi:hypothetical protein